MTKEERLESLLNRHLTGRRLASFLECDDTFDDPGLVLVASFICAWLAQEIHDDVELVEPASEPTRMESWPPYDERAGVIGRRFEYVRHSGCIDENDGLCCTRADAHDGPHVAHLDADTAVAWWPQTRPAETEAA